MNNSLNLIKLNLAQRLEKMGSSLEEFENFLNSPVDLEKKAGVVGDVMTGMLRAGEGAALLSFLTGAAGGGLAYGLKSHLTSKDEQIKDKQQEAARINFLTKRLKAEHGLN